MKNNIYVGYKYKEEFSFSQEDVITFSKLSGDTNPLHLCEEFAKNTMFGKPIIQGLLGSSIFSKVLGTKLYGEGTIYMNQYVEFRSPMFVDTPYIVIAEVIDIQKEKNRAVIKTIVLDSSRNLVITGEALIKNEKIC